MVKRLPEETDERIRSLWYTGHSRPDIEKETGASAGHIAKVVNEEERLLGSGNVEALRRLAKPVRELKVSRVDVMRYVRFANACKLLEVDVEDCIDNLPQVIEACKEAKITLRQLPIDIEAKAAKAEELENRARDAEEAAQAAEMRRKDGENKEKYSKEERDKFHKTMDWLETLGLSIEHPEKLKNMFANAERENYDVKALVQKASNFYMMDAELMRLEGAIKRLTIQKEELDRQVAPLLEQVRKYSDQIREIQELDRMGFDSSVRRSIIDVIRKTASDGNLSHEQAARKFVHDILTRYNTLSGLDFEIQARQNGLNGLDGMMRSQNLLFDAHLQAIGSLKNLQKYGVDDLMIIAIDRIARKGLNPRQFLEKLERYFSLEEVLRELEERISELRKEELALNQRIATLKPKKSARRKLRRPPSNKT